MMKYLNIRLMVRFILKLENINKKKALLQISNITVNALFKIMMYIKAKKYHTKNTKL